MEFTKQAAVLSVVLTLCLLCRFEAQERKFFPDDPLRVDDDTIDVPREPTEIEPSDMFDQFGHILADLGSPDLVEAQNVNTLDEAPEDRGSPTGTVLTSIPDLVRGPNTIDGPGMSTP